MRNEVTRPSCICNPVSAIYLTSHTYPILDSERQREPILNKDELIGCLARKVCSTHIQADLTKQHLKGLRLEPKEEESNILSPDRCIVDGFHPDFANGFTSLTQSSSVSEKTGMSSERYLVGLGSSSKPAGYTCFKCSRISISPPAATTWQHKSVHCGGNRVWLE